MTNRLQIQFGTIIFFSLIASLGVFLAFYIKTPKVIKSYALPVTTGIDKSFVAPESTFAEELFSQPSPDGTKKITMSVVKDKDSGKTYTFMTANGDNSNQVRIYAFTLPESENMSVPFNSFSPDNKYLFVIHSKDGVNEAYVFKTNGDPMTETEHYFKVAETFKIKEINNPYKETTGWASETLLIINTMPENGSKQSYWLEIPSKVIIQLSTQFYD